MPTQKDVFLGRVPRTNKDDGGTDDFELYSLQHFVKLALQGQTVTIDMLFAPTGLTTLGEKNGHIWQDLTSLREKFLSKKMNAFIGYARGQAAKYSLKGSRLSKLEEFEMILDHELFPEITLLESLWEFLPKDEERINNNGIKELQISGKWYGAKTPIVHVHASVERLIDRYGHRANRAAAMGGTDWKAMSHAVRVSLELKELLTTKNLIFPLKDKEMLLKIKLGQEKFEKVEEILDQLLAEIEVISANSDLPDEPDRKFIEDWLVDICRQYYT